MDVIKFLKRELPLLALVLAPIIYLIIVWDKLPDQLPRQWSFNGEVVNYGPKYYIVLLNVGLYLLLLLAPIIDPRKKNYDIFSSTYFKLRLTLALFCSTISTLIITKGLGYDINIDKIILIGVILLFITLGNYLGTIKSNWFIGIRVPWTLQNDVVWRKTHILAGRLWFWVGLVLLFLSFLLPYRILNITLFVCILIMVIIPIVYSYVIYQKVIKS